MITIDSEFKALIPPLTAEERAELECSLLTDGCRDALVLWGDTLIDGHNRYEICTRHNIPFEVVRKEFDSRQSAIEWMILNQFGRRNLPAHERARLALRLKPVIAEKAKEKQAEYHGNQYESGLSQKSVEVQKPIDTQKELAKVAGVSHDTIAKVEVIENKAPEPVVQASRKGEISVNSAYQVTRLEPEKQEEIAQRMEQGEPPKAVIEEVRKRPHVANNSGNNEWYTPAEYIEAARSAMGSIDTDPASSEIANRIVKAAVFYTAESSGLEQKWTGNVWLNPPYASDLIGKFIDKLIAERQNFRQAIVLVNNATETEWFNRLISVASAVCFPKSRVKFYMPDGKTGAPLQGQAVVYVGENKLAFLTAFRDFGWEADVHGIQQQRENSEP